MVLINTIFDIIISNLEISKCFSNLESSKSEPVKK